MRLFLTEPHRSPVAAPSPAPRGRLGGLELSPCSVFPHESGRYPVAGEDPGRPPRRGGWPGRGRALKLGRSALGPGRGHPFFTTPHQRRHPSRLSACGSVWKTSAPEARRCRGRRTVRPPSPSRPEQPTRLLPRGRQISTTKRHWQTSPRARCEVRGYPNLGARSFVFHPCLLIICARFDDRSAAKTSRVACRTGKPAAGDQSDLIRPNVRHLSTV